MSSANTALLDPRSQTLDAAVGAMPAPVDACQDIYARALLLWPGLDRRRLVRTHGDPRKVARLVARRTIHGEEAILRLLRHE